MLIINSMDDDSAFGDISIFPNPCINSCTIASAEAFKLRVADLTGKIVYTNPSMQSTHRLQTDQWAAGTYTLIVNNGNGQTTRTLIIQR